MQFIHGKKCLIVIILSICTLCLVYSENPMVYIYHGPESSNDVRYNYHWEILKAALEITKDEYGSYIMRIADRMAENRQIVEMENASGKLTVMIRETSIEYEKLFEPVRIPIDKDLIGYRVFLIRKQDQLKFNNVNTFDDLKKFSIGQGVGWGDIDILRANGFKVIAGSQYEGLFQMLLSHRFDIFSRGIAEVVDEYEQRKAAMPELSIEESILLYYPLPTYFWFTKNEVGKFLAERVRTGMLKMIDNGSFDRIFMKYHSDIIKLHNLKNRKLFSIDNSFLPATTPFNDKKLWYDPFAE